ncbi:ankyrin [Aaosphaeria arxii CBS 175.79]|uniref:Ankyrin n=1 Tax=Aaosphaeria arxii CBS 175.79 TaxID=1450172 RepID=A0A6A5YBF3_9PLEO|nr:ankyrin [Aaosphaeria arxii CBS 175.79]KAF2021944.1 ankyrin [Aaosphaeria arxii CBS 175.79]
MLRRLVTRSYGVARIYEELKALAAKGNLDKFKECMQRCDSIKSTKWDWLGIREWGNVPCADSKTMMLHEVLMVAAEAGRSEIVKYLMEERGCVVFLSAALVALHNHRWPVLELFLDNGGDINYLYNNMYPFLRHALDSVEQTAWCLEHGADPIGRTAAHDKTVAGLAAECAPLPVIKLLRKYGTDYTQTDALQMAAAGLVPNRLAVMEYLVHEANFPIDQLELEYFPYAFKAYAGNGLGTALHAAARHGCQEAIEFLLQNGADRDKVDTKGRKPIDLARENGFDAGVRLLSQ